MECHQNTILKYFHFHVKASELRQPTTNPVSQPSRNLNEICLTDFLQFHFLNLIHDPLGLLFSQKMVGQIFQSKGFSRKTEITAISYSSSHPITQREKLSLSPHSLTLQAPVIVEAFCKSIAIIFRISFTAPHLPSSYQSCQRTFGMFHSAQRWPF